MKGHKRYRSGAWRLAVYAGKTPDGKKRWKYRTVKAADTRTGEREADKVLAAMVTEVEAGQHQPTDRLTVGEVFDRWQSLKRSSWSPYYADTVARVVRNHLEPLAPMRVEDVRPANLDAIYADLSGRGLKASTISRVHAVAHAGFGQAPKWGEIATNPVDMASPPKVRTREIDPPDPADIARVIADLSDERPDLALFIRLAATTGARRGQLVGLKWEDFDDGAVTFTRAIAIEDGKPVAKGTKTDRPYRVALDASTEAAVKAHRPRVVELGLRLGVGEVPWVFPSPQDPTAPVRPDGMTQAWTRLRGRYGLDGVRLHDLRHGVATQLLADGVDVRTVAGRLGHANPNVTLRVYSHFLPERDQDAADRMADILDGSG